MDDSTGGRILEVCTETTSLREIGQRHLRLGCWRDAAAAFAAIERPDGATEMRRCLSQNLAELQEYRPEIYATITSASPGRRYQIIRSKYGKLSIAVEDAGQLTPLSPGNDPAANIAQALTSIKSQRESDRPMALCGLGDGWVLASLAQLESEQAIFIIQPNAALLPAVLAIHDCSGPRGPIQDKRFLWLVGCEWAADFHRVISSDRVIPFPEINISQGDGAGDIEAVLAANRHESENERAQ